METRSDSLSKNKAEVINNFFKKMQETLAESGLFSPGSAISKVENVSKMAETIADKISKDKLDPLKTLILFDLDLTIFDRAGIMSDLYPQERKMFLDSLAEVDPALINIVYAQSPYKLIEETHNRVLRLDKEPEKSDIKSDMLVVQKKDDHLTVYWMQNDEIISKSFKETEAIDILPRLPQVGEESHDLTLVDAITSKYGCLFEANIAHNIKKLVDQGFVVLGFTSRRTGKAKKNDLMFVEEDACVSLQQLGVNFSKIATQEFNIPENSIQLENPNLRSYEVIGKPKIFGDAFGVATIFTANYPKWLILELVVNHLSTLKINITDVIQVDDNLKYLQTTQSSCKEKQLNFIGLHYTFAHDHKHKLDTYIVDIQTSHLINSGEWLSESAVLEKPKSHMFMVG